MCAEITWLERFISLFAKPMLIKVNEINENFHCRILATKIVKTRNIAAFVVYFMLVKANCILSTCCRRNGSKHYLQIINISYLTKQISIFALAKRFAVNKETCLNHLSTVVDIQYRARMKCV